MNRARPVRARALPAAGIPAALAAFDPVLARVYAARGVQAPEDLDYSLARLAPVSTLENVAAAVDLLLAHRDGRILVVGDFDVDGATSTALMLRCLRDFGFVDVDYLVPNRFVYGYGLSPEIVAVAAGRRPTLIVTVDNGVSSIAGVAAASAAGIAVLVTDHHLPGTELPAADVMVNPNLPGSRFRSRNLAGVGVAFYVLAALGRELERRGMPGAMRVPARYLDLVALGTVADVVALDANNRILVEQGIRRIRGGHAVAGIAALLTVAGREPRRVVSTDLGFAAGPRLNAAGRLEDMSIGIECLLTDDPSAALRHAAALDTINRERRGIETTMREQAFAFVENMDPVRLPACICVYDRSWHQGIVGLVAARVKDRWHRPVVAFAREEGGRLKGSVRSTGGVHARDLLESVASARPGIIERFGGHAMAAGLTLAESAYEEFTSIAARQLRALYPDADFSGALVTDGPLPGEALTLGLARTLRDAGPWGAGFPEPMFSGDFDVVEQRTVGEVHLKLRVRPAAGGPNMNAIAFHQAGPAYRGRVRLVYRLDINDYRGLQSPELVVEQISDLGEA
ncbi:MAG TPA: single-stranded-DNA-specific exonuclease RecJ [Woeseiaceae bacterium]|nr:single-stranded-DNA-specific exonuclease RecJ [Woeseiaceae bacterium]